MLEDDDETIASIAPFAFPSSLAAIYTFPPFRYRIRASSNPMPDVAPVTTKTLPRWLGRAVSVSGSGEEGKSCVQQVPMVPYCIVGLDWGEICVSRVDGDGDVGVGVDIGRDVYISSKCSMYRIPFLDIKIWMGWDGMLQRITSITYLPNA